MKKRLQLLGLALLISSVTLAQRRATTSELKSAKMAVKTEAKQLTALVKSKTIEVLGTTNGGTVLQNENGEQMVLLTTGQIVPFTSNYNRPKRPPTYILNNCKVIGTTATGSPVWTNENGQNFTIDATTGNKSEYVGHVTLLR